MPLFIFPCNSATDKVSISWDSIIVDIAILIYGLSPLILCDRFNTSHVTLAIFTFVILSKIE